MFIVLSFLFTVGLFLGSFINVLADRLPNSEPVIVGRSRCDHCKHVLSVRDLIPLLSFIFLRARCRYCKKRLSVWYPAVEVLSGLTLVVAWLWVGHLPYSFAYFVLLTTIFLSFLALFVADAKYQILPDALIVLGIIGVIGMRSVIFLGTGSSVAGVAGGFLSAFATGFGNALFFLLLVLITSGRGMGIGDIKLAFFIGFFLGFPLGAFAIYLAFLTGGTLAAILVLTRIKRFGQTIAFGPFLIVGALVSFFASNYILKLLTRFIL